VPRTWRTPTTVVLAVVLALLGAPTARATGPTPTPSPSPSGTSGAPAASGDGVVDEHTAAVLVAATAALQQAQAQLTVAKAALDQATAARQAAEAAATRAQTDLDAAVLAEADAKRDVEAVKARITGQLQTIGTLARTAYEANGPLETWAVLLDSRTPTEMTSRAAMLGVVSGAGNANLARLEESRADLEDAQYRLSAATAERTAALTTAQKAVTTRQTEEAAAQAAAQQVTAHVAAQQAAYQAALKAQQVDLAQYRNLIAVSGHLGQRIVDAEAKLAALPNPPHGTGIFDRPGRGDVTSPYGMRYHPILHYVKLHTGTDFAKADGIVYAADDGVVLFTELNVAYGNMTVIGHGKDATGHWIATMYAHQAAFFVKPGQRVRKGQPIGLIGATGYATGPHLHFEVRIDGRPVDPAPYLVGVPMPPVPTTLPAVVPLPTP